MKDAQVDFDALRQLSADIRIETIKAITEAGAGHMGGSMSIADTLAVLYGAVLNVKSDQPHWDERDWLVMSKGHCGPALYATLAIKGFFPMEMLATMNKPHTNLPSHCDRQRTPGIDMTTGSLGQGMSSAVGIALGNKLLGRNSYTYCIVGDGEIQEGQVWEGAAFAAHQNLDHFIVLVDDNKRQLDGYVQDLQKTDTKAKFEAFGYSVQSINGHDLKEIYEAIQNAKQVSGKPSVIILNTFKGMGCCVAEKLSFNHFMTMDWGMANEAIAVIKERLANGTYPGGDLQW